MLLFAPFEVALYVHVVVFTQGCLYALQASSVVAWQYNRVLEQMRFVLEKLAVQIIDINHNSKSKMSLSHYFPNGLDFRFFRQTRIE
jgi:hypothetical protein